MLITNIYNLADTAFVGKLGNSASGAVGVVFGFMAIIQAVGFMFGQGAGSIISRLLGNRDTKSASVNASTAFFSAFALGIVITAAGYIFINPLVNILGSTPTIAPYAKTYIRCILPAAPFMATGFVMNNILRFEGKAALGMAGLLTGSVLNILGDMVLMFGFKMGIAGAGISTALSNVVSFFILISMFLRGKTQSRISLKNVTFKPKVIGNIMATGLPSLLRQGLTSITTVLLNSCTAPYGDEAVAAMSIVSRVVFFVFSIAIGIGQGFQPVSGFNYGAKKYRRVKKAFTFTAVLAESVVAVIAMTVLAFSGVVIGIFRDDPTVIQIGTRALRLQCVSLLFLPISSCTEMLLQSTGKKLSASLLSAMRSGIFFIPSLLILSYLRGLNGIQEAQPLAYILAFVPTVFFLIHFFRNMPVEKTDENGETTCP
jgi:putative MATE family efflux protein